MAAGFSIKRIIAVKILFVIITSVLVGYFSYELIASKVAEKRDVIKIRERLLSEVSVSGLSETYAKIRQKYAPGDASAHLIAHVFGEILYEKGGYGGIALCDGSFGFGCFHGFITETMLKDGLNKLKYLEKICIEKFGSKQSGCLHGIGHGLLEYLGRDNLTKAFEACTTLSWKGTLLGCKNGAIMEYFFPTSRELNFEFDKSSPTDICPSLPNEYRSACYYELRNVWKSNGIGYEQMAIWCNDIENALDRQVCLLGVGDIMALSENFQTTKIIRYCETMPDFDAKLFCRAGASWSFTDKNPTRNRGDELCGALTPELKEKCIKVSALDKY